MNYIKHKSEESLEDYLETILVLSNRKPEVRSVDIAAEMDYSKPSVSVAMKNLKAHGYVHVSEEGYITLTPEGKKLASSVYERHTLISGWLIQLGVAPEVAKADACKMEHDMSQESFQAIKDYIRNTGK